jgi:signal transduction histidine kinase
VLRLTFAADRIAGELWGQTRYALALALACLVGGLVLLRAPLNYWLGDLGRMQSFEENMRSGAAPPGEMFGEHAPIEFKQTFDVLNRTASSLRAELSARESAMTSLRAVLEGLMPQATGAHPATPGDDIAAISQLISHLVAKLQERGEQLNAIFALSPDGFVSFDAARHVNYVSPAFTRLTGLAEAQVLGLGEAQFARLVGTQCAQGGRPLQDFDALRRRELESEAEREAHHRRDVIDLERPAKRVLEIGLRQGRSPGISQLLHLRDVTHETEVDQLKSEFLSTAAHELRTPMASIYGFSELMLMRPLPPEKQKEVIEIIHRQTALMISIVNELLDLARIEARRGKDFALEDLDLRSLAEEVMHDFKPPHDRPAPLTQLPHGPQPVRVDRSKMAQALGNVLSNAYKYSPEGGAVRLRIVRDAQARVGIEVADTGIGMTPEQLDRVSERFYRADASGSIPGTGLGMSIVKEIVELLGGSLSLASELGRGTTVTLWLPLAVVDEPVAA